jgi:hypothetical protein
MMLDRWRSNPISFIETVLHDPETKKPFKLLPAERAFLEHVTAPRSSLSPLTKKRRWCAMPCCAAP